MQRYEDHLCEPLPHRLQAALHARMVAGDNKEDVDITDGISRFKVSPREALILTNVKGIADIASSMFPLARRDDHTRKDLMQAGVVGLMKALDRWDPKRARLNTYAYWKIRWEQMQVIAGLRPASRSTWKTEIFAVALDAVDEGGQCLLDSMAAPVETDQRQEQTRDDAGRSVPAMLSWCSPISRDIVTWRVLKSLTWCKVARLASRKLGRTVSRDYVQRVLRDVLAQLRARLEGKHAQLEQELGAVQMELSLPDPTPEPKPKKNVKSKVLTMIAGVNPSDHPEPCSALYQSQHTPRN